MELVVDPVCDMEFDQRAAAALSVYQNRIYYFCHPVCKKIFDADPARFVQAQDPEPSGGPVHMSGEGKDQMDPILDCEWISPVGSPIRETRSLQ